MDNLMYKRVLLKLSGEVFGRDFVQLDKVALAIKNLVSIGVEVAVVVGGGNLFRGRELRASLGSIAADSIGMLSTVINAIALQEILERHGVAARSMSALPVQGVMREFDRAKALRSLQKGHVVIFAGGTGNPLVSTDSAASLRAVQINADLILKATSVDGVYSADPRKDKTAVKYDYVSYADAVNHNLEVMDLTAFVQCKEHNIPIIVFNFDHMDKLVDIVHGKKIGTLVGGNR